MPDRAEGERPLAEVRLRAAASSSSSHSRPQIARAPARTRPAASSSALRAASASVTPAESADAAAANGSATLARDGAQVVLIPGDGTGPELTEATRRVLEATGVEFEWDVREAGADVMEQARRQPAAARRARRDPRDGRRAEGADHDPVGGGFRSVNVALRKELDMYAQIRPCKSYPGVRSASTTST